MTVGSSTAAQTFILTAGTTKAVTYVAGAGETTATIALALWTLASASGDGEFSELDWGSAPTTAAFNVTGPADGAPFTLTASGTGTLTVAVVTAPLSPHDMNDGANYSTAALPAANDTLVFENSVIDAKYNADALAALALTWVRRKTHTGRLGLPVNNPKGYPEYRVSEVSVKSTTSITIELNARDRAGNVRLNVVNSTAPTLTISGQGASQVGAEVVEVRGLPAASVVSLVNGSLAVCPYAGQVATVATFVAEDSSFRLGSGVTLSTSAYLKNTSGEIWCNYPLLTMVGGGTVYALGAATGSASGTIVYKGTLVWMSTSGPGNSPVIGTGGAIDFGQAPGAVTVGGTAVLNPGGAWRDPAARVTAGYVIKLDACSNGDTAFDPGVNRTLTVN